MKKFNRKEVSFEEKLAISDLCIRQAENSARNGAVHLVFVKAIYDVALLAILGEKVADGVTCTKENSVCNIEINIDSEKLIEVLGGKKAKSLKRKVKNYDEVWGEILETIRLYNVALAIRAFGESLPSTEEMRAQMKDMQSFVDENKEIVETAIEYEAKEGIKKEVKKKK